MSLKSQTLTYTKPGVYSFTVPEGIGEIEIAIWGAGGAAGQGATSSTEEVGRVKIGERIIGQQLVTPASSRSVVVTRERVIPGQPGYVVPGGQQTITNPGTTTVQLPAGVTQATVVATGGGGGAGRVSSAGNNKASSNRPPVQTATGAKVASAPTPAVPTKGQPQPTAPVTSRNAKGGTVASPPAATGRAK